MARRRATALVSFVVLVAVAQIVIEDIVVFFGATGTVGPAGLTSPYVMIGVPFVLFLLLAGAVFAWALTTDEPQP